MSDITYIKKAINLGWLMEPYKLNFPTHRKMIEKEDILPAFTSQRLCLLRLAFGASSDGREVAA